ncbi:UNVERIFIED_CONTAM: hypothetical protein Sangu_1674300 [Sesamum angustifolium]|uniref:PLAC8 family protein n=1 Tax=Sesamum angustifolium TaxID=2727405 RepID=A0AAW2MK85_9LAMI
MGSQAHLDKMQLRQNYRNLWHTDLMRTIQQDPPYCCLALWCGPCVSYMLRKRALYNDMSRYVCCAGYMPCSGRCGESRCPEFCLATEGVCLYAGKQVLSDDVTFNTTQHKVEMDKRDGKFGPQPAMAVPAAQQMSRLDQPYPLLLDILLLHMGASQLILLHGQPNYPPQGAGYPPPAGYPPAGYQR